MGVMVLIFLVKFIFNRRKVDRSNMMEIKEKDHPQLFDFIKRINKETDTKFPKKIYLTQDVNAAVFFDSTLLSMFFPVRKNLMIGLGLVNVVNVSELKAIIAHEFGHFSQKSMKLGSYVYNVNHVIHDMLYNNDSYGNLLDKWAHMSGIFAIFANITIGIVRAIQAVLQATYRVVQKSYSGLSQQMEFHADTVAAYVSGSAPLITSLYRLEAADLAYNNLFSKYNQWAAQSIKPDNLYPQFTQVMHHFANVFKIPVENGLPQVTEDSLQYFNQSKLVIKNQWASHPSTEDRAAHLNSLGLHAEIVHETGLEPVHQCGNPPEKNDRARIRRGLNFPKSRWSSIWKPLGKNTWPNFGNGLFTRISTASTTIANRPTSLRRKKRRFPSTRTTLLLKNFYPKRTRPYPPI